MTNIANIAEIQPGYRVIRHEMPWIKYGVTISGADFDRANLPMVVACSRCGHTMTLNSRNCWVGRNCGRIWCNECKPDRFTTRFLEGKSPYASGDSVSRVASELYRLAQSFKAMMADPNVHADECRTRWVSRRYRGLAVLACIIQDFNDIASALDTIEARTTSKHVYHSAIKAFIDEVAG